jgi:DNA-binding CsgD family transcriptional regulator
MTDYNKTFEHDGQKFTYREAQIIVCCAHGLTARQAADLFCISYHTVKAHRDHIRDRFGLHGHHALDQFAIKLLPELEQSVTLPTKIGNVTDWLDKNSALPLS